MNTSVAWLRAFVPFGETAQQLREMITAKVATVDELVPLRSDLNAIVVARVVEEGPHPDSDHLHVTKVDMGAGELLDVVCGAPNVAAGKLYPFAPTGTVMPNGLKIEKRKIRGQVSNGMICSARELGLGEEHDGVMELSIDVPPGTPFLRAMPVGDSRLVIDVGANRPDLLSHLGVAREIAAMTRRPLGLPKLDIPLAPVADAIAGADSAVAGHGVRVAVDDPSLVRRFMGVVIRGVRVGPSPQWLVDRLTAIGSRSINNVVDASNYVLHELGQPTHAFDLAKLAGPEVRVRLARGGERITTLDGTERTLQPTMIVIADRDRPQAIAGVMGGRDSEVTDGTTDLFIEVANFDPARIRAARRSLAMTSDASYRFERGVDLEIGPRALDRVAQIIIGIAGGSVDGAPVDLRVSRPISARIPLRTSRVTQLLGARIDVHDIERYLTAIGFRFFGGDAEHSGVEPPSWREDVVAEVDVIEEIARLHGYDRFPDDLHAYRPGTVPDDPHWLVSRALRDMLVGRGLYEVRPMPFVAGSAHHVRISNPLAESEAHLRHALIETLARRVEFNLARMHRDIRLFEVGNVFSATSDSMPVEELHVGAVLLGRRAPRHFTDPNGEDFERWSMYDRWDVAALAQEICHVAFRGEPVVVRPVEKALTILETMEVEWMIYRGESPIGMVGRLRVDAPVWAAAAWAVELSLGLVESKAPAEQGHHSYVTVRKGPPVTRPFTALPTTPAAEFDLAVLLSASQRAADVERVIRESAGDLLERLELFDQYIDEGLGDAARSVAWRLTFRHPERTLKDKEIEGRRAKILSALEKELNVRPRTS
jgi:phenylalanyl-tRNA synthetase beta chain